MHATQRGRTHEKLYLEEHPANQQPIMSKPMLELIVWGGSGSGKTSGIGTVSAQMLAGEKNDSAEKMAIALLNLL